MNCLILVLQGSGFLLLWQILNSFQKNKLFQMKRSLLFGSLIAIGISLWVLVMHLAGRFSPENVEVNAMDYFSMIIPIVGLFFGIRSKRDTHIGDFSVWNR